MDPVLQPQWWTSQYQADERRREVEAGQAARKAAARTLSGRQALSILRSRPAPP